MKKSQYLVFVSIALLVIGVALAYYAYFVPLTSAFNSYEAVASIIFWGALISLVLGFPLRRSLRLFSKYIKTGRGLVTFVSYISVHLILYGLLLEIVLAHIFRMPPETTHFSYYLTSVLFYPLSFSSVITGFGFNPSLSFLLPPLYNLALSMYSICLGFIIAILVTANVVRVTELGKVCSLAQKSRALVLLPAIGVVGGAICCVSLPVIISLAAPAAAAISNSPIAFYFAYFLFPPATVIGLKYNLDSTDRIGANLERIAILGTPK